MVCYHSFLFLIFCYLFDSDLYYLDNIYRSFSVIELDSCIDALVIRGALQMAHFLSGEYVPSIAWLEKRQNEKDLVRPGHKIRMIVAPIVVITLILLRKTSISDLIHLIEKSFQTNSLKEFTNIINFHEIDKEFSTNGLLYAMGTIYAAIVSLARKMYLLL